jgi:hypothetical protein
MFMKALIIKYDNGYAVTVTDTVPRGISGPVGGAKQEMEERQRKHVFENRAAMLAWLDQVQL